jgi:A/G-specific adenine glycosylase
MNFYTQLINWYSDNKRSLPWRDTDNPYFIWLSEIILQQTQVKQGLPYYKAFVKQFPTVFDLANASEEQVLKLWQGLGYYSRARNLHTSAKYIANELNGIFPSTFDDIKKLKGVGDYTASAIASIAFKEPKAVVDGNVYRVLSRYFGIKTAINSTSGIKEFKALAQELISKEQPHIYNQAIMEFGALQCTPKTPNCELCPFKNGCVALKENLINELPIKLKKTKVAKKYFNYMVCVDDKKNILFEKREGKGIWRNLYQFPLIESDKSLTAEEFDELKFDSTLTKPFYYDYALYNESDRVHKLSHQHLYTKFWIIEVKDTLKDGYIPLEEIHKFPVPVLIGDFIEEFNFEAL